MTDRIYHKCPECAKVQYFQEGDLLICKQCGHAVADDEEPPALSTAAMLGLGGIGCAVLALIALFFFPFAVLACLAAFGLGLAAILMREEDDTTAAVIGGIAMVAGIGAGLTLYLLWSLDFSCSGCIGSSGESTGPEGGSGGGIDGGGGGSGGGIDAGGGGGGGGVGTPFLEIPLIATSLLLVLQRMRRHG